MLTRPSIDAVITMLVWDAHEAATRLCECLAGGVARRATWRLFVLDQGSALATASMLAAFAGRLGERAVLKHLNQNIGYPAGHNLLHREARVRYDSRYLVTINSDVVFDDPCWLDGLVDFMDADGDAGIAGPTGVVYERTPAHRLGWCRTCTPEESRPGEFDSISGSVCIIRQAMIERIGLFDESFTPGYYEDTDLSMRAKAAGWRLALCAVHHRHHDLGEDKSTAKIKHQELTDQYGNFQKRNRNLFVERWLTGTLLYVPGAYPETARSHRLKTGATTVPGLDPRLRSERPCGTGVPPVIHRRDGGATGVSGRTLNREMVQRMFPGVYLPELEAVPC